MATSKIQKNGKEVTAITFVDGIVDATYDNSVIVKRGNVVSVIMNCKTTGTIDAYAKLATLPVGFRPMNVMFPIAEYGREISAINVRPNGDILSDFYKQIEANVRIVAAFTFII